MLRLLFIDQGRSYQNFTFKYNKFSYKFYILKIFWYLLHVTLWAICIRLINLYFTVHKLVLCGQLLSKDSYHDTVSNILDHNDSLDLYLIN